MTYADIPGWTCAEIEALYRETADRLETGTVVEIGVAYGRSLAYLAERAKRGVRLAT